MAFLKVAMLKLLFEFDVVTFAQEIMSVQGQLTLSTYDVRLRLNPVSFRRHINTSTDIRTGRQVDVGYWLYDVVTKIQPISDVKLTSDACYDVAVFQWITSCHKNRMTTLLREYVTSLTTSVTTM